MDELQRQFRREVEEEAWHHSSLAKYMREHPDKVEEMLASAGADWDWAARAFAYSGLTDHTRKDPTAETARETWRRVEERRRRP